MKQSLVFYFDAEAW